jgi:hypothetical protein
LKLCTQGVHCCSKMNGGCTLLRFMVIHGFTASYLNSKRKEHLVTSTGEGG